MVTTVRKIVKVRKDHQCHKCNITIKKKDSALRLKLYPAGNTCTYNGPVDTVLSYYICAACCKGGHNG